jgi:hypothetical protein
LRPTVVLASQRDKTAQTTEFPFSLAYEMFERGLVDSTYWLIIGYSFRDRSVNALLQSEFAERLTKPQVLVITMGESPNCHDVERAFGWNKEDGDSAGWLTIFRDGADGVEDTEEWQSFCSLAQSSAQPVSALNVDPF